MLQPLQDPSKRFFDQVVVEPSYIIFKVGDTILAKNGQTGQVEFSSADATYVIQRAIDATHERGGGVVFIKVGFYDLKDKTISLKSGVSLVGEGWGTLLARTVSLNTPAVDVYGVTDVVIADLKISGGEPAETVSLSAACIRVAGGSKRVVITRVYARGATYPIYIGGGSPDNWTEDILVYGNVAEYAGDDNITVSGYGRRVVIAYNIARYAKDHPTFGNSGIEVDDSSQDVIIANNLVYGNYDTGIEVHQHPEPTWPSDAPVNRNIAIVGNIVITRKAIDGTGVDNGIRVPSPAYANPQAENVIIADNIVIGGTIGTACTRNVTIRNNYVETLPGSNYAITVGHHDATATVTESVEVEGNIVVHRGDYDGILAYRNTRNVSVKNNRVKGGVPAITFNCAGGVVEGNIVYNDNASNRWPYGSITMAAEGVVRNNIIIDDRPVAEKKSRGILIKNASNVVVEGNRVVGATAGVWCDTNADRAIIRKNVIKDIYTPTSGIYVPDNVAPTFIVIEGNYVDNITHDTAYPRGVIIGSGNKAVIRGNVIGTSRDGRRIQVGDSEAHIHDNVLAAGGMIAVYTTRPYSIKRNVGYATENSGVATIPAGSTRVTVSHGLATAPGKVLVTPYANIRVWVENITSTTFDIVTDVAPAADVNVAWYAEV